MAVVYAYFFAQYAPLAEELAMYYDHVLFQAIVNRAWRVANRLASEYPQAERSGHPRCPVVDDVMSIREVS